jgi:hypothetical protein
MATSVLGSGHERVRDPRTSAAAIQFSGATLCLRRDKSLKRIQMFDKIKTATFEVPQGFTSCGQQSKQCC